MKVQHTSGHYFREATEGDILFISQCMSDWLAGAHRPTQVERAVKETVWSDLNNKLQQVPIPTIKNIYSVFCLADDTPVGAFRWSYYDYEITGFMIDHLSLHPDQRAKGFYTNLIEESIVWFANQYLQADEGTYTVLLDGVPGYDLDETSPVYQRSLARRPERADLGYSEACRKHTKTIKLIKSEVAATLTPAQKSAYTVILP